MGNGWGNHFGNGNIRAFVRGQVPISENNSSQCSRSMWGRVKLRRASVVQRVRVCVEDWGIYISCDTVDMG